MAVGVFVLMYFCTDMFIHFRMRYVWAYLLGRYVEARISRILQVHGLKVSEEAAKKGLGFLEVCPMVYSINTLCSNSREPQRITVRTLEERCIKEAFIRPYVEGSGPIHHC
jgi:hypothetical protein